MNKIIKAVREWGENNLLSFNKSKTQAVLFSRLKKPRTKPRHTIALTMDNEPLQLNKSATYLGVVLDQRLTFKEHITGRINRGKKLLFALNSIISKEWGLSGNAIKTIYKAIIVPSVFWAVTVWSRCLEFKVYINKLLALQRLAAIKITKCLSTTATDSLLVLAGLPPIYLVGLRLASNSTHRQIQNAPVSSRLDILTTSDSHLTPLALTNLHHRQI